jgi:hypothetical protein
VEGSGVREIIQESVNLLAVKLEVPLAEIVQRHDGHAPGVRERLVPCEIACAFGREPPPRIDGPAVRAVQVDASTVAGGRPVVQRLPSEQRPEGRDRGTDIRLALGIARHDAYAVELAVVPAVGPIRMTELRPAAVQAVITKVLDVRSPRTAVNVYQVFSEMLGGGRAMGRDRDQPGSGDPSAARAAAEAARPGSGDVQRDPGARLGPSGGGTGGPGDRHRHAARRDPRVAVEPCGSRPQGAAVASTLSVTGGEFTFPTPKTSRARRSVDLPAFVVAFLRRHRKEQNERKLAYRDVWSDHDIVLDNGVGQPLSPWTVSADFRRVIAELGLPKTRFHDLRHAHATQLLSAGVHVKAVSERLGHASTSFTMARTRAVIPSMGRAAADAADQLFEEGGNR